MIVLILFLTTLGAVSAKHPDYYAIQTENYDGYKVFTRRLDCTDPVYESGDNRVLFKLDQSWIIGSLNNDNLECQNIASNVNNKHYEFKGNTPTDGNPWVDIRKSNNHNLIQKSIGLKSFNKCEEIPGLRLSAGTSFNEMENCKSKNYWAKNYPGKTVFVDITDNWGCHFDTRKDVKLFTGLSAKLFIHSSCVRDKKDGGADEQQEGEEKVQERIINLPPQGNIVSFLISQNESAFKSIDTHKYQICIFHSN